VPCGIGADATVDRVDDTSAEMASWLMDQFAPLGPVRTRAMFGGRGVWVDDTMVALVAQGRGYLKTDEQSRPAFEAAGSEPFRYLRRDGAVITMSYWSIPEDAEDEARFDRWAEAAFSAATRARKRR
jgi:DNA transformation protein and related proteins